MTIELEQFLWLLVLILETIKNIELDLGFFFPGVSKNQTLKNQSPLSEDLKQTKQEIKKSI